MKIFLRSLLGLLFLAVVVFLTGPTVDAPVIDKPLPELSVAIEDLPQWVQKQNEAFPNIKPGNESELIFADSIPQKQLMLLFIFTAFLEAQQMGLPCIKKWLKP